MTPKLRVNRKANVMHISRNRHALKARKSFNKDIVPGPQMTNSLRNVVNQVCSQFFSHLRAFTRASTPANKSKLTPQSGTTNTRIYTPRLTCLSCSLDRFFKWTERGVGVRAFTWARHPNVTSRAAPARGNGGTGWRRASDGDARAAEEVIVRSCSRHGAKHGGLGHLRRCP